MKIFFYSTEKKNTTYTYELLRYIAKKYNHEEVNNINTADICAITLTSFYEIDKLRILRKNNPKIKIIVGGHASNHPETLLRYADYINLGQGFEFFRQCVKLDDIENKPYIISKSKVSGIFSQYVDWNNIPLVKIGKYSYSYLWSIGCRNKCKFCLTSWINKFQINPFKNIKRLKELIGNSQLYLITNDYRELNYKRGVSDIVIKEYLRNPNKYDNITLIRVGIESPSLETRKYLNKNISNNEIYELLKTTKEHKKRMNMFFIVGLDDEDSWLTFNDHIPKDYDARPYAWLICNYFCAITGTPLERFDMRKIIHVNLNRIKERLNNHNARMKIFWDKSLKPYNALFEVMFNRSHWDEVDKVLEMKKKKYNSLDHFFDTADNMGLMHLIDGTHKKYINIDYNIK